MRSKTVEFARHAFPPVAVGDIEAMGSSTLSHMSYTAAHAIFFLVAGPLRFQLLGDIEVGHAGCDVREVVLRSQISELGNDIQGFEQKCLLLAAEKAVVEETETMFIDYIR